MSGAKAKSLLDWKKAYLVDNLIYMASLVDGLRFVARQIGSYLLLMSVWMFNINSDHRSISFSYQNGFCLINRFSCFDVSLTVLLPCCNSGLGV